MRHVAIFLLTFVAVVASGLAVSRGPQLLIEARSPGAWSFNHADYRQCVIVRTPPIAPRNGVPIAGTERTSELS